MVGQGDFKIFFRKNKVKKILAELPPVGLEPSMLDYKLSALSIAPLRHLIETSFTIILFILLVKFFELILGLVGIP